MKIIAILDTETTGLSPTDDRVIEIAVTVYSLEHATPLRSFATLLHATSNAAEAVNRIPAAVLATRGYDAEATWRDVQDFVCGVDAFVAHRAEFDRSFTPERVANLAPWVCSKFDLAWPHGKPGDHLVHLALAHGVPVIGAHRAQTDVDILCRLFTRVAELGVDLPAFLAHGMRPKATFEVKDKGFDEARNALAKEAGFRWESGLRAWRRRMFVEEAANLPFAVVEVP